jgi:glycosyltransferase 2 family protein
MIITRTGLARRDGGRYQPGWANTAMWPFLLKVSFSAVLLWLLFRGFDLSAVFGTITNVEPFALALAIGCYWCVALPSALRWSKVVEALGHRLPFGRALLLVLIGYFFNQTILSSLGGDGVRSWKAYRAGLPGVVAVVGILVDRTMQYVGHILLMLAALPPMFALVPDWRLRTTVLVFLGASIAGILVAATADCLVRRFQHFKLVRWTQPFSVGLRKVLFVPRRLMLTALLGVANQVGVFAVVVILALGLALPISWAQCLVVVPIAMLVATLPITVGGWGVREGSFVAGFGLIGISGTDALTLSVLFGLVTMVVRLLPGGLIWLAIVDRRVNSFVPNR